MSYNPFQTVLDESHLKPGTKLKKGDEELKVVKPVGDDKYLVKEEEAELTEAKHRVSVTVSDPNHTAVSKRKEQTQKTVRVSAESESDAVTKAKAFYKKQGYKVHDAAHAGIVHEEVEPIAELSTDLLKRYQKASDKSQKDMHKKIDKGVDYNTHNKLLHKTGKRENGWADAQRRVRSGYSHITDSAKVEGDQIDEKTLTPAELKKREEVAKAMERDTPGMDKSKKMAIATAVAKRVAESMVAREKDGRKFVSAEAAIRLARELAAKRKPGEKATHADLQAAAKHLTREEVELEEGVVSKIKGAIKQVKRGMQGWTSDEQPITGTKNKPKDVVDRAKNLNDKDIKDVHSAVTSPGQGLYGKGEFKNPNKHSPAGLQLRVLDREMKKRGLTKEEVEQIDEISKETQLSYATKSGDHAVRLAKAIKVRKEQGRGESQEVKDMEGDRDKRVKGLARLAKRVSEAKEEKNPTDMTGAKCEKCKKDKYKERSQYDDMDGKVTCSCGHRVDRWKKYKN